MFTSFITIHRTIYVPRGDNALMHGMQRRRKRDNVTAPWRYLMRTEWLEMRKSAKNFYANASADRIRCIW